VLYHLGAESRAEARTLSGGAQDEQPLDAALEDVFQEAFETGHIQLVVSQERSDHGRNNTAEE